MQYTQEQEQLVKQFKSALDKAKITLMRRPDSAFFTSLCFSLWHKVDFTCPTAATDGLSVYYNPHCFMSLPVQEQLFLMLHEVMHVALMHMCRGFGLDQEVFNYAADYVINYMLVKAGFTKPDWMIYDSRFDGMSTEAVYKILIAEKRAQMPLPANPGLGDIRPVPSDKPMEEIKQQIENIVVQASIRSAQENDKPGTIPGVLQILLDQLLNPKLPWHRIFQKYLTSYAKDDYTWRKPNRRYFPEHHLPSLYSEKLCDLAIAVDTSGSVSDEEFQHMVTEIASIFKMKKPESITLLQFDTRLHTVTKLKSVRELMACKFSGRGGTKVEPVMEWAAANKPQLLVIFTDGGFRNPIETYPRAVQQHTLWLIHNDPSFTAPFGKKVHYEIGG